MGIVVVGTIFVDIKGHPFQKLTDDGRNPGRVDYIHGGVGRNVAEDLVKIGADATLVGLADKTGTASDVIKHLQEVNVNTDFIKCTENGMGTWLAIFDENGDVVNSISARTDITPLVDVLDENHEQIFKDADSIIIEVDIDEAVVERVFYYAGKYRKNVYALISVMSVAKERIEYIRKTEGFICNIQEAELLFGCSLSGLEIKEIEALVQEKTAQMGIKSVIVTMSEKGAIFVGSDGETGYCPAKEAKLVDSTGAGDSFCAGFAAARTYGKSMKEACEIGATVSAAVITTTDNVPEQMDIF